MNKVLTMLAVVLGVACPVAAQDIKAGGALYQRYCAACHGPGATGHGPMRPVLLVPPADLTGLAAERGQVFPLLRVISRINGSDPLVSHGSAMPVYGDFFEGRDVLLEGEDGKPVMVSQPMADLIAYLRSVQAR